VIIYGSRALGTARNGSDIDLCIKVEHDSEHIMSRLFHEIDDSYIPHKVDLALYSEIDNPQLIEHIDSKGQLFFKSK
jgi:predicted nucleotidyltransferase